MPSYMTLRIAKNSSLMPITATVLHIGKQNTLFLIKFCLANINVLGFYKTA